MWHQPDRQTIAGHQQAFGAQSRRIAAAVVAAPAAGAVDGVWARPQAKQAHLGSGLGLAGVADWGDLGLKSGSGMAPGSEPRADPLDAAGLRAGGSVASHGRRAASP